MRQVQAEAVFNTANAIRSAQAYQAAIDNARMAHDSLNRSIQATGQSFGQLNTSLSISRGNISTHATALNTMAGNYQHLTRQANIAATAMQNASRVRPPAAPPAGGGGGGGGNGGGGGFFGGGYVHQYHGGAPGIQIPGGIAGVGIGAMIYGVSTLSTSLTEVSDKWIDIGGRIAIAVRDSKALYQTQEDLFAVAQKTRTGYEVIGDMFARIAVNGRAVGVTTAQSVALTEIIADTGRAAHRTTSEILSFSTQFPQALAEGRVRGEEFKSILKSYKPLVDAISESWKNADGTIGISIGKLQQMARETGLPLKQTINAMLDARQKMADLAAQAPRTVEQSFVQLSNMFMKTAGNAAEAVGFTNSMTASVDKLIASLQGGGAASLLQRLYTGIASGFDAIVTAVSNGSLVDGLNKAVDEATKFGKALLTIASAITDVVASIEKWASRYDAFSKFTDFVIRTVSPLQGLKNSVEQIAEGLDRLKDKAISGDDLVKIGTNPAGLAALLAGRAPGKDGGKLVSGDVGEYVPTNLPEDPKIAAARKHMAEKLAEQRDQLMVLQLRAANKVDMADRAEGNLAIEKAITAEMREKLPLESAKLAMLIQQNTELKIAERHRQEEKGVKEKIDTLREQMAMDAILATGDQRSIEAARTNLAVEKAITQELRDRHPELARILEANIRLHEEQKRQQEASRQWTDMYREMGDTIVNSMMAAGKEGRSFASGLKDAAKQMIELVIRAVLLKPLVESISSSLGQMTGSAAGGGPGSFVGQGSKMLGGLFGSSFGDVGMGSWAPTITAARGAAFLDGSVTRYAKGGVVSSPTNFVHGGGAGQMGEIGTEGILPLFRGKDGNLGVKMAGAGGGGNSNSFTFHIAGDATDETVNKLTAAFSRMIDERQPGIVKASLAATRTEIQRNSRFTRRD